ncbi:MAG: hypothetical protein ABIJ56_13840 [Pseudomonadota bacterium]
MSTGKKAKDKKKKKQLDIDSGIVERLEEAARGMGIEIRYDQMPRPGYSGGLCRIRKQWVLIVNRASMPLERAEIIAGAISTREIDNVYLPPDVREFIKYVDNKGKKDDENKDDD